VITDEPLLSVSGLRVVLDSGVAIVEGLELALNRGEILGVVGESGSGKTTAAMAIMGFAQRGTRIVAGEVAVAGERARLGNHSWSAGGRLVAYVPQNPGTALNPSLRVKALVEDLLLAHEAGRKRPAVEDLMVSVELPPTPEFGRRFPHQLSGGQQQRLCIAAALACGSPVVILDEPTTGLDVVTQARILEGLLELRRAVGLTMVYVTHDIAVIGQIADRVAVMYGGRIVEEGPRTAVLGTPLHPYTRGLLMSIPDHVRTRALQAMPGIAAAPGERPGGCAFAPRCPLVTTKCETTLPDLQEIEGERRVRCFEWNRTPKIEFRPATKPGDAEVSGSGVSLRVENLRAAHQHRGKSVVVAKDVSFDVGRKECVALVGESGSGKTTIARTIAGLHPLDGGEILLAGEPLRGLAQTRSVAQRRQLQMIFQNPADALNPRQTVRRIVARPAQLLRGLRGKALETEVADLLVRVRLPSRIERRYPTELSGGECQRVAIARALAAGPDVLICDEVTSALDVSVQAAVLALLDSLRTTLGLALVFITHDLGVVATIANRVLVLDRGIVCESGQVDDVLRNPTDPYTRRLIEAAPTLAAVVNDDADMAASSSTQI